MGLTEIIFDIKPAEIGVITLDASVKEVHRVSAKATRHPIEVDGGGQTDISDHVLSDPPAITIDGVVTNTPIDFLATFVNDGSDDPAKDAWLEFARNVLLGELVTIKTTLQNYYNMQLESIEVTRNAAKGNALYFVATAVSVILVELSTTPTAASGANVAGSTKSGGKTPPAVADPATAIKSQSALDKGLQFARNLGS